MYELMLYSLKAGACLAVFYLFFKLLLSRETFHRLNRIILLSAIVASFLLPLCVITVQKEVELTASEIAIPDLFSPVAQVAPEPTAFPWKELVGGIFLLGVIVSLGATVRSLWGVMRRIGCNPRESLGAGTMLVRSREDVTPFSWWRYIVISERDLSESGEEILLHEGAHIRMRHSIDLLVTDIAGCLQWFNPAMWLLRRELREIHEYEADEAVLNSGADARQYQMLLIKKAAGGRWYSVANSFNHSKLKNRITMMLRKKSSRWSGAKALLTLPLAGLALGAFAQTVYVFPNDKDAKKNVKTQSYMVAIKNEAGKPSQMTINGSPADSLIRADGMLLLVDGREVGSIEEIGMAQVSASELIIGSAAQEKYGEKAKNGVVMVTTRKAGDRAMTGQIARTRNSSNGAAQSPDVQKTTMVMVNGDSGKPTAANANATVMTVNYTYQTDSADVAKVFAATAQGIEQAVAKQDPSALRKLENAMSGIEDILSKRSGMKVTPEVQKQLSNTLAQLEDLRTQMQKPKEPGKAVSVVVVGNKTSDKEIGPKSVSSSYNVTFLDGENPESRPLVIIDGKEVAMDDVKSLKSKDVESISILKDASATTTYGDGAKYGVMIVKTKKAAQKQSSSISVTTKVGEGITLDEYPEGMLVFIDGKKASRKDYKAIDRQKVKRMQQSTGDAAVKKYGKEARNGVLEIFTSK